eukprot:TRINITY_DN5594_c0_g2_i1.p1 TRINITY_DN5594_c0_g2~~TRINITY_DN5594_c0_g2_i1.p1  ORF type:complete len:192 (+),score=50.63 TRINITY_DN5594_c0_g2_i1:1-576(+)
MEHCPSTLDRFLDSRRGAISVSAAAEIITQLALCLKKLHDQGIYHQDLKPDNILVVKMPWREVPLVKLCDFGLSAFLSQGELYVRAKDYDDEVDMKEALECVQDVTSEGAAEQDLQDFKTIFGNILDCVTKQERNGDHHFLPALQDQQQQLCKDITDFSSALKRLKEVNLWNSFENKKFLSPFLDWWAEEM